MPIIHCSCGQALAYKPESAGRTFKCPKCQLALIVPQAPVPQPPVELSPLGGVGPGQCPSCGSPLGQRSVHCPICGSMTIGLATSHPSSALRQNPLPFPARLRGRAQRQLRIRHFMPLVLGLPMSAALIWFVWSMRSTIRDLVVPPPYRVSAATRAEFLVVYDQLSRETTEPDVLGNTSEKFRIGGEQRLLFHRRSESSNLWLIELKILNSEMERLKLADVTLRANGNEMALEAFLEPRSNPIRIDISDTPFHAGDQSWNRILPRLVSLGYESHIVIGQKGSSFFTDQSAQGQFELTISAGRQGYLENPATAVGSISIRKGDAVGRSFGRRANIEIIGAVSLASRPGLHCTYNGQVVDVEWSQHETPWLAQSTVSKYRSWSRYQRVVCLFIGPPDASSIELRIGAGPTIPVFTRQ